MPYFFREGGLFLVLGLLLKRFLQLCDQLRRAVNQLGKLLNGIGYGLHSNVQKIDVAILVYNEKADRNDVEAGSAAAAKVLLQGSIGLAVDEGNRGTIWHRRDLRNSASRQFGYEFYVRG